jgi:hypothetical protein
MKCKKSLVLLASLAFVLLDSGIGVTRSSFVDLESSGINNFQAWASTQWLQTTQEHFNAGVFDAAQIDISSSGGDVMLAIKSDWYDADWLYRRQITIDHTKVDDVADPSTTYADFPVMVYATGLSNIKADGADIRFTSSNGVTELPREIESYTGGTLYAWVKVTLTQDASDASDDVIYMYYGNDAASEPAPDSTYGSENVWDSHFLMVQHLQEDPDDPNPVFKDSTSNDHDGINWGYMDSSDQVLGKIDGSIEFDGIDDRINLGDIGTLSNNTFSVSVWVKVPDASPRQEMVWGAVTDNTTERIRLDVYDTKINFHDLYDMDTSSNNGTIEVDQWHHVVATYDYPNQEAFIYINGEFKAGDTSFSQAPDTLGAIQIGSRDGAHYVNGVLDEVRISDIDRSAEWIKTSYINQDSPSDFCNIASEEGQYVSSGTIASQVRDTGVAGASWVALFWDETLQSNTNITFEARASDVIFDKSDGSPGWTDLGAANSPITTGLPSGQYMQWRATLTTSDDSKTPTLHEVRVYHY